MINRARSCAVTGHRILEKGFNRAKVEEKLSQLIKIGYNEFLVGMALGFDTVCFQILEKLRETNNIKIIACIPCKTQADRFSKNDKKEYERMLLSADEKVVLSEEYTPYCMQKRNKFMVDNASVVLAYLRNEKTGTANTVKYAKERQVVIINV